MSYTELDGKKKSAIFVDIELIVFCKVNNFPSEISLFIHKSVIYITKNKIIHKSVKDVFTFLNTFASVNNNYKYETNNIIPLIPALHFRQCDGSRTDRLADGLDRRCL